jgi:quercetin dioxygenase-like cupin family protein
MREGEVTSRAPGETIRCIRSGESGGPFVFYLELAPGAGGPPTHTHDEGLEILEILEGEVAFRVNGKTRILAAGDTLTLTPNDPHTFWNPSKIHAMRAKVTHGVRFERLIVQPGTTALAMYVTYVDPGASRLSKPIMRMACGLLAFLGRLCGVRMLTLTERP